MDFNLWGMIATIVVVGCITGVITTYIEARAKHGLGADAKREMESVRRELAASRNDVEQLRDRVAVLERLATDGDRRLAGEIDRLRRHEQPRSGV